jgi:hypothetical protein
MNIILLSEVFGQVHKGTSVYVNEVSKYLSKSPNMNINLFVPKFSNKGNFYKDKFGRKIFEINNKNKNDFLKNLEIQLDNFIKKNQVDIIHCLYGHYFHFIKKYNKTVIWTCHNLPPAENKPLFFTDIYLLNLVNRFYFLLIFIKHIYLIRKNSCKLIIVPSKNVYNKLVVYKNLINKKINIIGNGTNNIFTKKQKKTNKKKYKIVTISSFKYHKNLILIPDILKNLSRLNVSWTIVGQKEQREYYDYFQKKVKYFKLGKRLKVISKISEKSKVQLIKKSDLYVQLSSSEGFGIPILESRMLGLNAISTNCGAAMEIFKDLGGEIINNLSTKHIVHLILKNISKQQKRNRLKINKWTWKSQSLQLTKIYESFQKK